MHLSYKIYPNRQPVQKKTATWAATALVGDEGLEPPTSSTSRTRSSQLS